MNIEREPNPQNVCNCGRVPNAAKAERCPNPPAKPETIVWLHERHFTEPKPIKCKWCGADDTKKYGIRKGVQEYICLKCGRKFIDKDRVQGTIVDAIDSDLCTTNTTWNL